MTLIEFVGLFEERKNWIVSTTELSKDALHIYFGLALFIAVRLAWRWRGGWLAAWLAVVAMAIGGEWLDMTGEVARTSLVPGAAHWHDIWNTTFWPTILLIVGRWLQPSIDFRANPGTSGEHAERRLEQA